MEKRSIACCALLASLTLTIMGCGEDHEGVVADTTPPSVKDVIVAGDISAAATNGPIIIVFSEAVDPASVQTAVTFSPQIDCAMSYEEEICTLTCDPKSDLQDHTMYSVTVSGVVDKAGNVMETFTFDILTSEKDIEPPAILKTTPSDGESEAPVDPRFNIEFSERIDQTGFEQGLSLTPDVGIPAEQWLYRWSEDDKQVEIFIPLEKGLEPEHKFNLRIAASSVVDLVGNRMEKSLQIEFTTAKRGYEDINPESNTEPEQGWLYIIWKQGDTWHIIWGGTAPAGATKRGQGTIFSDDGEIDNVNTVRWEAGDTYNLSGNGVLTFSAAVDGAGGTDGLEFEVKGKTVTFRLSNARSEWIFIGRDRKHPESTTFTLLNEE